MAAALALAFAPEFLAAMLSKKLLLPALYSSESGTCRRVEEFRPKLLALIPVEACLLKLGIPVEPERFNPAIPADAFLLKPGIPDEAFLFNPPIPVFEVALFKLGDEPLFA